jgi:hypothetical protein
MTQRFSTILTEATSVEFSPGTDPVIQIVSAIPVTIDVEVKMDASLNYAGAYSVRSDSVPVLRLVKVPFMRFKVRGNTAGNQVELWDNS